MSEGFWGSRAREIGSLVICIFLIFCFGSGILRINKDEIAFRHGDAIAAVGKLIMHLTKSFEAMGSE
ncbi:MAG: hypothetical protein AAGA75_11695 [Cyanobacteria bacterium P01_E01_bin.6]